MLVNIKRLVSLSLQNSQRMPKLNTRNCSLQTYFLRPNVCEKIHLFLSSTKKRCAQKNIGSILGWLGSRVVSVLDSRAEGPGFKSQSRRCR